jgi:hypothetical protein
MACGVPYPSRMLIWRGFFLGPHGDMHAADGPVFASRGSDDATARCLTAAEGRRDGDSARFLARIAGIAAASVLYLDIDEGGSAEYFAAWVAAVQTGGFTPGVTGSPAAVVLLGERGIDLGQWMFRAIYVEAGNVAGEGVEQWVH